MPPKNLYLRTTHASAFQEPSVVEAYQYRPPYPDEVFTILQALLPAPPPRVLDLGAGTGFLARRLAPLVAQVDAVDISGRMIEQGRRLPGGDHPHLQWIVGSAEEAPLHGPYALVTIGDAIHWLDWRVVLPRLARVLQPDGWLIILDNLTGPTPWGGELRALIQEYSTVKEWVDLDVIADLEALGLFEKHGERTTTPLPFIQSIDEYIESFHGRASLSRERLTPEQAHAFDRAVRDLVTAYHPRTVTLSHFAKVVWGKPLGE